MVKASKTKASVTSSVKKPKKLYSKTTNIQTLLMISWLENRDNFNVIVGKAAKGPVVSGTKLKKIDGFRDLANYVNKHDKQIWNSDHAKQRYNAMLTKYKKTKSQYEDNSGTKFCLTEDEVQCGFTIEKKLYDICPGYHRLDVLFGSRQNVDPFSVYEPNDDENEEEDKDDKEDEEDDEDDEDEEDEEDDEDQEDVEEVVHENIAAGITGQFPDFNDIGTLQYDR